MIVLVEYNTQQSTINDKHNTLQYITDKQYNKQHNTQHITVNKQHTTIHNT